MYDIKTIELELATVCNAYCPVCIRYDARDEGLFLNPKANLNQLIDLDTIDKCFKSDKIPDDVEVSLVGTSGDPLAHPKILDIIKLILHHKSHATFNIHTNGGLRSTKLFAELAHILGDGDRFCFSLDGLADTNHIYRIGVDFKKVISNMTAFIEAGGTPIWQFVIFDWNKHQIEECRKYAFDLGCRAFESRENVNPGLIDVAIASANKQIVNAVSPSFYSDSMAESDDYDYIDDACIQEQGIFMAPDGKVYPCCMFYAERAGPGSTLVYDTMYKKFGYDWNDLTIYSLDQILDHAWWDELHTSIVKSPCVTCINNCGAVRDERSNSDINEKAYQNISRTLI